MMQHREDPVTARRRPKREPTTAPRRKMSYREIAGAQEADLIRRYQAGDQHAGGVLIEAHRPIIYNFTKRYFFQGVDREDLLQEADLGFLHGVSKFNPRKNVKLTTYAIYWVRARVDRYLHDHCADVRVPVGVRDAYLGATKHGAETPEDIADSGYPQARTAARTIGALKKPLRLDAPLAHADNDGAIHTLGDLLASNQDGPEDMVIDADDITAKRQMIARAMVGLTDKERTVITLRILGDENGETMTLREIGDMFEVTRERIRQIEAKALDKIKRGLLRCEADVGTTTFHEEADDAPKRRTRRAKVAFTDEIPTY